VRKCETEKKERNTLKSHRRGGGDVVEEPSMVHSAHCTRVVHGGNVVEIVQVNVNWCMRPLRITTKLGVGKEKIQPKLCGIVALAIL
jgi:hypothetical protein